MYGSPEWIHGSLVTVESLLMQMDAGKNDTCRERTAVHCDVLLAEAPAEFHEQIQLLRRLSSLYFGHHFLSHRSLQARDIRMRALVCCVSLRYGMTYHARTGAVS